MAPRGHATFVGFGFGPIQAGLFCYEAMHSGIFRHLVVAEVNAQVVAAVRAAGGFYTLNVAHPDHIEAVSIGPVQMENPQVAADRARLVEAVAAAQEIATALPAIHAYRSTGENSIHRILAQGLQRKAAVGGPVALVYAAENHPHAAQLLAAAVMDEVPEADRAAVAHSARFANMVIPKMSLVISPPDDLAPLTGASDRAFLAESCNKILVGQNVFDRGRAAFESGFPTFVVKDDLVPFATAKFLGHNGIHALGGYLGLAAGLKRVTEWTATPGMMAFLRAAFVQETGAGLIHRYAGMDALFTPAAFAAFADDLLARMVNPYLRDTTARLVRDPARKLGWNDRLLGAMRVAHEAGIVPWRFALGAAAALDALDPTAEPSALLPALWQEANPAPSEVTTMLALVQEGVQRFHAWRAAGFPDLTKIGL